MTNRSVEGSGRGASPAARTLTVGRGRRSQVSYRQEDGTFGLGRADVDIVFVFDTTGSMCSKIEALVATISELVADLDGFNLDWRVSVVPFGDLKVPGDRIVGSLPFTSQVSVAQQQLRDMPRFSGGGNAGESSIEAVLAGLDKEFRPSAVRVLVLLTDEPAHGCDRASRVAQRLLDDEVVYFGVTPPLRYFQQWAEATGGRWYRMCADARPDGLLELLRSLCREVADVSRRVHELAGGSVATYRSLPPGGR